MPPVFFSVLMSAASLYAAAAWMSKPPSQWNEADAKEFLAESPWVAFAQIQPIPPRSVDTRRESGDWDSGIGRGVGIAGTGILDRTRERAALERAHELPDLGKVTVLWASAAPVRAAQSTLKADGPDWSRDYYEVTLVGFPFKGHLNVGQLKGIAYIRRTSHKDMKPVRVELVHQTDDDVTIVYLFSRSEEILQKDGPILFVAQVGQTVVSQYFHADQMVLNGLLEL